MRYTKSKNKVARREATDLGLKTPGSKAQASLLRKLNILPGQHGTRKRRKVSERGKQLREKQKLRFMFGITETKQKFYFNKAKLRKGNTGVVLGYLLESRLDNVVYRLGFAPTRASARQLVSHGHFKINGAVVDIASYHMKPGEVISFNEEKSKKIPYIEASLAANNILPSWLERKGETGSLKVAPTSEEIEKQVLMQSVIEYYSR
jgi:small subunit ribosomal protein S4